MSGMDTPPNRVEELREEAGLSRVDLAVACGVGEMTIRRWERGETEIKDEQKLTLASLFAERLGRPISREHLMGWDRLPATTGKAA